MSLPRARLVISPLPARGGKGRLAAEEAAHARARRLRTGDPVTLVDSSGRQARAVLTRLDARGGEVLVEEVLEPSGEPEVPIALLVSGLRAERLAWIAEKATELGAASVTIVLTCRTQSHRAAPGVLDRLERVAREAAKQCEATRWPRLSGPDPLEKALEEHSSARRLILDPSGESFPVRIAGASVALLVGPEGGWTSEELESAASAGWAATALPASKLRAETAAIAALVLARSALARGRRD